jgi:predicted nucleic acid-binding protein
MRLLDADVLVDIQRNYAPAVAWYQSLTELPHVPGLVIMELVQHAQNQRQVRAALQIVRPLPVIWPSEADCDRALADYIAFHLSHNLGLLDALIAACAVGRAATLCTFNVKHYRVIASLVTGQPYVR